MEASELSSALGVGFSIVDLFIHHDTIVADICSYWMMLGSAHGTESTVASAGPPLAGSFFSVDPAATMGDTLEGSLSSVDPEDQEEEAQDDRRPTGDPIDI